MAEPRKRRVVRRAVWTLAVVVLLGLAVTWLTTREPSEIRRSRALRLGMTRAEVEAVMGKYDGRWGVGKLDPAGGSAGGRGGGGTTNGIYFGKKRALKFRIFDWIGLTTKVQHDDWPVRVRFDDDGHVDLIKRRGEL